MSRDSVAGLAAAVALVCAVPACAWGQSSPVQPVPPAAQGAPAPAAPAAPPGPCDAACVRAFTDRAAQACAPRIEAQAPTDYDWVLRPYGNIFQQGDTPDAEHPAIRYRGDSIRFLSPQKDWVRVTYECAFDPGVQRIVGVTVRLGRLDRPAPVQPGQAAAPRPSAPPALRKPPAKMAPQAGGAPRKPPREASEIEFFQVSPQAGAKTQ
jgi:hypothetical protein